MGGRGGGETREQTEPAAAEGADPGSTWAWLGPILVLAEFLRLPYLVHPWLKDQAAIHAVIADLSEGRTATAFPMPYTTTAFHRLLGGLFDTFGESLLLPRLLAASLAAASTVATWVLARRLFGHTAAVVAALLTATSPLLLSTPAVGLPNDPLIFLLSLLALHAGLRRRSAGLVALSAAIISAGMYVRFFYAPALPLYGLLVLLLAPRGHRIRLAGAYAVAGGALLVPLSWLLLGTDDGVAVLKFVREATTGSSTMHTAMGQAMGTPFLQRLGESVVTVHQILLGRMNVGGLMHAAGANWVGLATGIGGVGLAMLRALRPRPDRALEDRLLAGWLVGAFAILVLVVAWPSEISDPSLGPYRAPRYFILLFPAPWIAAGALVALATARLDVRPRVLALLGLAALVSIPASPLGSVALLSGRVGRVVTEARDVTAGLVQAVVAQTGETPVLLADVPPGDVFNWNRPRFALTYETFLDQLDGPEAWAAWRQDKRLGLALAYSQMLYQVQPDLYSLDVDVGGHRVETRVNLLDLPWPPLQPVIEGSEGVGPEVPYLVAVSSSPGAAVLRQRVPGVHEDKRIDRISRFEKMNPGLTRLVTVLGKTQPAYAFYRVDLQDRVWSNLSLRFGLPDHAVAANQGAWAFPETIFTPELGYGFTHALLETGRWRNAGRGLLPRYPVSFQVRVPEDGVYEGAITIGRGCQSPAGLVVAGGRVLEAEPDSRCEDDSNVVWLPEVHRFCVKPVDGRVSLTFLPRPRWTTPWLLEELALRRADGTPEALRLGGCSPEEVAGGEPPPPTPVPDVAPAPPPAPTAAAAPDPGRALVVLAGRAPELVDPAGDAPDLHPRDDLRSAHAVVDDVALYARIRLGGPPAQDLRFWVEQEPAMVAVTLKVGSPDRRCELSPVSGGSSTAVPGCFWLGPEGVDVQLPRAALAPLATDRTLWVSGFQTCCRDAAREVPIDGIEGAQEVWRVP